MIFDFQHITPVLTGDEQIRLDDEQRGRITRSFDFLKIFARNKVIYGINTGFGPMAQWRIDDRYLHDLQYNIIRSHSTGAGRPLDRMYVRASMIARLGSIACGYSGIDPKAADLLQEFINQDITPFVPEHGSVGASGDLVQLAHIALCLIGEGEVLYKGEWRPTAQVLEECGLQPLTISLREGLSLTNGTSVMTGISFVNILHARNLLDLAIVASVWINEISESYDDMLSETLNGARPHPGQLYVADRMRHLARGSRRLPKREHEFYETTHTERVFEHKVQPYYSLRCTPQILGPIYDTIEYAAQVIECEFNSASDNPIVDVQTANVYHGGNFHGDYISLEADKIKIAMTRLVMTAERQLNYLMHDRINGILPPFLNMGKLGLNYGMQACQFTATSTTAECQTLSMPNYVHSIPNNNDNQDIVSMGTNSALLCARVIDNAYQVMAILYMALAQATDCLNILDLLSPVTQEAYGSVRVLADPIVADRAHYRDIEGVIEWMKNNKL